MNKFILSIGLAVAALVAPVRAETDYVAVPMIRDIQRGEPNVNAIRKLRVVGTEASNVRADLNVGGALVVSGAVRSVAGILAEATSLTVTSGQIVVLGNYPIIKMTPGGADLTVTCTVAAASSAYVGASYLFVNVGASNGVLVVDSAPVYNSGATLGAFDSSTYKVVATNQIVQSATSNN